MHILKHLKRSQKYHIIRNVSEHCLLYGINGKQRIKRNLYVEDWNFSTTQERRKLLRDTWYFDCQCVRCVDNDDHVLSSMFCPSCRVSNWWDKLLVMHPRSNFRFTRFTFGSFFIFKGIDWSVISEDILIAYIGSNITLISYFLRSCVTMVFWDETLQINATRYAVKRARWSNP